MAETITTIDPTNGEDLQSYVAMTEAEVSAVLDRAAEAQVAWAALDIKERSAALVRVAATLRERSAELAELATREMGKPLAESLAEVEKCAWVCEYYAQLSPSVLADEIVEASGSRSWITYEPLGVVLAIMPWNYPYWQVLRFAAPALVSGNAAILKHSPNVTGCALAVQDIFIEADLPKGLFATIVVAEPDVPATVDRLIADNRIAAVSLTGSNRAGEAVGASAGRASKKSVLELGGSDPFVILADADLDTVIPKAVAGRFHNAGQSCLSAKRFIVHESIADEFGRRFAEAAKALVVGDPTNSATNVGPLARADLAEELERQVTSSVQAGARILTGGKRLDRGPAWFAPTVLVDVTLDMPVMSQETFGPAAAVISFADDDEAVRVANATQFGLAASVWSSDEAHALRVGKKISSGALFINAVVASDPRLPFGGVKQSGYGRELGEAGAKEFTNIRTVLVG